LSIQAAVVNVQELAIDSAKKERNSTTAEQACSAIRDAAIECMECGKPLILRLGHTTPDFMLLWHLPDILPLEFFELSHKIQPGSRLPKELEHMHPDMPVTVEEKYLLAVTSCLDMNSYHSLLSSKLPLANFQPIQVVEDYQAVLDVLQNGLDTQNLDDALSELDRLADML